MSDKDLELNEVEQEDGIVELIDEFGEKSKFFHIGTMDYKEKTYAFFQPAEDIEGADPDDVVIFEIQGNDENGMLLPIEDEDLLEEIFEEFVKEYNNEYDDDADKLS